VLENYTGTIPENYPFVLEIPGVKNQNSARDAGDWSVTTYLNYDGFYYEVDTLTVDKSFTAVVGAVSSTYPIEVTNPINYGQNSIYTLKFITENDIPANGFIRVKAPSQVLIDINTTKATGTCS